MTQSKIYTKRRVDKILVTLEVQRFTSRTPRMSGGRALRAGLRGAFLTDLFDQV